MSSRVSTFYRELPLWSAIFHVTGSECETSSSRNTVAACKRSHKLMRKPTFLSSVDKRVD
jgi:hypothetical protein